MAQQQTEKPRDLDPWGSYYFSLEINQVEIAHFQECSGIKTSAEVFEIEEGGVNDYTHKRAGYSKWDNIVLKGAIHESEQFVQWREQYLVPPYTPGDKQKDRPNSSAAIVLRNNAGDEIRRYTIMAAFPVSWEGPSLNAGSSALALETLEIAHDGILIDKSQPAPPEPPPAPPEQLETEPVQFELASSELKPEGKETVDKLSDDLAEHPEIETVYVEGHTCTQPCDEKGKPLPHSAGINEPLSEDRAKVCAERLQASNPDKKFIAKGYGFQHPVASNSTPAGRSQNRRTEFWTVPRSGKRPNEKS